MHFDPHTLVTINMLGALMMSVGLFAATRGYLSRIEGLTRWATATVLQALGWALFALGHVVPPLVAATLGSSLVMLGLAMYLDALFEFKREPVRRRWPYALVGGALLGQVYFIAVRPDAAGRFVVVSACAASLLFASARVLLRPEGRSPRLSSERLTGGVFAACGVVFAARACYYLFFQTAPDQPLVSAGPLQDLTQLASYVASDMLTFGFVLMCSEQYNLEIGRLGIIAQKTGNAVLVTNAAGTVEWVNAAFVKLTGYRLEEAVGHRPGTLLQVPGTDPHLLQTMRTAQARQQSFDVEVQNRHKDGSTYWIQLKVDPVFDTSGRLLQWVGVQTDISARKRAEERLLLEQQAAERANRAKTEFLANMSHEIRTPLNAIMGLGELLLDTPLDASQRQSLDSMRAAGTHLLKVINDVLDVAKIEARKVELESEPFSLRALVDDLERLMNARMRDSPVKLICMVADEVGETVTGDASRLRQVLVNLLDNACKFTRRGAVWLSVARDSAVAHGYEFVVSDTGVGIAADRLDAIFDSFTQADNSITRRYGGTGLGLTISKALVELMGGRIEVESAMGKGASFRFSLSLPASAAQNAKLEPAHAPPMPAHDTFATASPDTRGARILIVDDVAINREIVAGFLRGSSWAAECAEDGPTAVERCKAGGIDLVLMDIQMPGMDGYEATRRIRAAESQSGAARVPIIAVTAHAMREEIERCLEAGCDGHVGKPVTRAALMSAVQSFIRPPSAPAERPRAVAPERPRAGMSRAAVPPEVAHLVDPYLDSCEQQIEALRSAVANGDYRTIGLHGHRLRGTAGAFGFTPMTEIGVRLEGAATARDDAGILQLITDFERHVARLRATEGASAT